MTTRSFWTNLCVVVGRYNISPANLMESAGISKEVYKTWTSKTPSDEEIDKILEALKKCDPSMNITKTDLLNGPSLLSPAPASKQKAKPAPASVEDKLKAKKEVPAKASDAATEKCTENKVVSEKCTDNKTESHFKDAMPAPVVANKPAVQQKAEKASSAPVRPAKQTSPALQKEITRQSQEFAQRLMELIKSSEDRVELSAKEKELIGLTKKMQPKDLDMLLSFAKRLA